MTAEPDATEPSGSVPASVLAQARAAFGSVDRTAHVAVLVRDSLDEDGDPELRTVVFSSDELDVVVTVQEAADGPVMLVAVEPADAEGLEVHVTGGDVPTAVPAGPGSWTVRPVPSGPVSLGLRRAGSAVRTAWTRF